MKIAIINTFCKGSTGCVADNIANFYTEKGHAVKKFYGRLKTKDTDWCYIGTSKFLNLISNIFVYFTGLVGFFHVYETLKLLKEIKKFNPDYINLHNIHGNYLNFKMIFKYIKKNKIKVLVTMHDCFYFTGRCAHFFGNGCSSYKSKCKGCAFNKEYPHVLIDRTKKLFKEKQRIYENLDVKFIAVSNWLKNCALESALLKNKNVICIQNGFSPFEALPEININKKQLLAVSQNWNDSKGLFVLNKLADIFYDYRIIAVGNLCKGCKMNECITHIPFISEKKKLVELYSNSFCFLNFSQQESFPTVNIESLFCGCPIISNGLSGQSDFKNDYGFFENDGSGLENVIKKIENIDRLRVMSSSREKYSISRMKYAYWGLIDE